MPKLTITLDTDLAVTPELQKHAGELVLFGLKLVYDERLDRLTDREKTIVIDLIRERTSEFGLNPDGLNLNQDRRDQLLKPYFDLHHKGYSERWHRSVEPYMGGIESFQGMPVGVLKQLVVERFASNTDAQNSAPSVGSFIEFGDRFPNDVTFFGYAVHRSRSDYRVSIEGIETTGGTVSLELRKAWNKLGKTADEKSPTRLWWD